MLRDKFQPNRKPKKDEPKPPEEATYSPPMQAQVAPSSTMNTGTWNNLNRLSSTYLAVPTTAQQNAPTVQASQAQADAEPPKTQSGLEGLVINDNYLVERLLASGGMGRVFLCTHLKRDNMKVVLKLMLRQADPKSKVFNQFIQECIVSGRLRHPNLVKVLDYGILLEDLKPYLVMEYVEGASLRDILRIRVQMDMKEAAELMIQALEGLHEIHSKGIVHRDLKPENLMVKGDHRLPDNLKILDFGIAQLQAGQSLDAGKAVGSVGYMSPEQISAEQVDARTDLYSLGLIFYELIIGQVPFKGLTAADTMRLHLTAEHTDPSMLGSFENPKLLDTIVAKALAKFPKDRYSSAKEMQEDFRFLLDN